MKYGRFKKNIIIKGFEDLKKEGILYFILKTYRFFLHKYLDNNRYFIVNKLKKKPGDNFIFNDEKISYLLHPYNLSWTNERTVEVPIILNFLKRIEGKNILEFGAVLPHYIKHEWDVLDRFETGENVLNMDIINFKADKKYDLIVSISTLEHVGYDDENKPEKIILAIDKLKSCLKKNGKFIATMPLGYNKFMDNLIFQNKLGFDKMFFLKRINRKNKWRQVSIYEVKNSRYNYPYNNANAVFIGVYEK